MRKLSKKTLAVATTVVLLSGGGAAYAYWTNSGTGTGSATTGTNLAITVAQTASSAVLLPGEAPSTLSGTFTNPNASAVYVHQVIGTLASVTGGGVAPLACTIADYALTTGTITIDAEVLADDSSTWSGIQVRMLDSGTNQDKCKNATINLTYASN